MYINLDLFERSGLNLEDVTLLTAIKQNAAGKKEEFLQRYLTVEKLAEYKEKDCVKEVKGNKKDSVYKLLRLEKKATDLLIKLSCEGAPDKDIDILINWLIPIYKAKSNGIIKNKTESARRLQWFKEVTEIKGNKLAILLSLFVGDSFVPENPKNFQEEFREFKENNPRAVLNNMLDNIAFSPETHFDKHYTLDKSPLYNYYTDNREFVESVWKQKGICDE